MRFLLPILAAPLLLGGCQSDDPISVTNGWVRLPAVPGRPAAAYFTVTAHDAPRSLVGISTPVAARAELHETVDKGGMMSMQPVAAVPLTVGVPVRFQPGGRHAMLFDLAGTAAAGAETTLTLRFEDGKTIDVPATLIAAGDETPTE